MINFEILFAFILAVFALIITPGPVVAFVIKNSTTGGFRASLQSIIGTNLASLILIAIASCVLLGIFTLNANFINFIAFLGSFFIIYLGVSGLLANLKGRDEISQIAPQNGKNFILSGLTLGLSNPKDIIFFISFFPQFIAVTGEVKISLLLLSVVWIVLDFSLLLLYGYFARRNFFIKHKKQISLIADAILCLIGILALFYAIKNLEIY